MNSVTQKPQSLQARIISGSVVLLSGSGLTMAINLAYNIAIARFLGPKGFGHATVVYTILTLLSAVTLAFQIVSTKVVAQQPTIEGRSAVYRFFHRGAWACGIIVALILVAFENPVAAYLNLPDVSLVALIAIGAAFYVPLGTRRGYIQGTCGFRALAVNMVLEQAVRLVGSLALILMGMGVHGVIIANSAAIAVAYFAVRVKTSGHMASPLKRSYVLRETLQSAVFFAGQMLINNCGIVMVNHYFAAKEAGLYAAVAMVGRVIFALSQAVVNSTFPLVAGGGEEARRDLRVIATSLMLVLGTGMTIAIGLCIAPNSLWTHLFGAEFQASGRYSISYLLALYAFATVIYSLGAVIITFEMSYKIANTSYVQLAFSGVLIAAICFFHSNLREVVLVQLALMVCLFVLVAVPFLWNSLSGPADLAHGPSDRPFRLIRRVSEDEVIAEFLRSDFHCAEFQNYQSMQELVGNPNFGDAEENSKRRALLFIRHLALWKELPADTEWYEVEVSDSDLENIRIFPRAQWRKVARGSFSAIEVAEGMRTRKHLLEESFVKKINAMSECFREGAANFAAVILIGVSENEPVTVLDGNHRLTAAMLAAHSPLNKLRFLCGFSPRMMECCWYNSNLVTLFRYGRNVLSHAVRNPESELARVLRDAS
ncbi:MAG TPA: oligosaccharide flippase family protein [Terracidiphilus sp.]